MSGKRKRTTLPKFRTAVASSDGTRASSSRATSTVPSRHVHMTVPADNSKGPSYSTSYHATPDETPTPSTSAPTSGVSSDDGEADDESMHNDHPPSPTSYHYQIQDEDARKKLRTTKRLRRVDHLTEFIAERDTFLEELLRAEGPAGKTVPHQCSCGNEPANLRCTDCFGSDLFCAECICQNHAHDPLHIIQRWTGNHFERYSLHQVGLCVQLGHDGRKCPRTGPETTLTIVDVFNIHLVCVKFCDCGRIRTSKHFVQMLRASWWPATLKRPKTGFTIRTLKLFQSLSLLGKTNAYDFWRSVVQMTDGSGVVDLKQRYEEFKFAMRCFRVVRMAKRAGRGQDASGFGGTPPGGLVVECPACPHPDKNMQTGWETVPDDQKWLHTSYYAIDANFKLKMKAHGYQDVSLADGMAYFVETTKFKAFLAGVPPEKLEMKGCDSKFAAVANANTAASRRFGINGAGAATCGRHFFFLPNGVGDLEKGERYINMTYILLSAIKNTVGASERLVISYDIACQFSVNFLERMEDFPTEFHIYISDRGIIWLVPKFHLPAHGSACQIIYAFNFRTGVGRSYGEGIEGNWAETNHAALMTREMPEAARHEMLDDVFGSINWNKLITFEDRLLKSLEHSVDAEATTQFQLVDLSSRFSLEVVAAWEKMIKDWEEDPTQPNPYEEPAIHEVTVKGCLEKLGKAEAAEAARGVLHPHEITASKFLGVGLDLQEQQRNLRTKQGKTEDERLSLQTQRNTLAHRIKAWRLIQTLYMPIVTQLMANVDDEAVSTGDTTPKPEEEKLWLPSDIPHEKWATGLSVGLAEKETLLREAEADDALYQVRRYIRMRMGLVHFKSVHVAGRGNKANTRAQDTIKNIMSKCRRAANRYIAARAALIKLCPKGGTWSTRLRPMNINTDLRNAAGVDPEDDLTDQRPMARRERALGEGHKDVPWIWRALAPSRKEQVNDDEATAEEVIEGMRSPYCKAQARHRRWKEEIALLCEEMRRVAEYFLWKRDEWLSLRGLRPGAHDGVQDGCNAYASRQAKMWEGLARRCVRKWESALEIMGLEVAWSARLRRTAGLPDTRSKPKSNNAASNTGPNTTPLATAATSTQRQPSVLPTPSDATPPEHLPPHPTPLADPVDVHIPNPRRKSRRYLPEAHERTFLERLLAAEEDIDGQDTDGALEDEEEEDDGDVADSDAADDD